MSMVIISGSEVSVSNVKSTADGIEFEVGPSDGDLFEEQPVFRFLNDSGASVSCVVAWVSPQGLVRTVAAVPVRKEEHSKLLPAIR